MTAQHLVVWYNTRCPVCNAGINRQRNKLLAAVQAGTIEFRDIDLEPEALAGHGASLADVRRRLHATDDAGRSSSAPTWRSRSGGSLPASAGWPRCSATRSCARSRVSPTTVSPTCSMPGIGAKGAGDLR